MLTSTAAINETKWLAGLLEELGLAKKSPAPIIYGDNQSTQELSKNDIKSERTKHIDIKYHFVQDEVKSGRVQLQWIPTTEQLADVLTKALGGPQHHALRSALLTPVRQRVDEVSKDDRARRADPRSVESRL